MPLELTGNYDLSYPFTRSNGIYRIATSFPVGQRQCSLHLGAKHGKTHGIGPIGREPAENITATPAGTITNNNLHRVDIAVRTVDDKAIGAVAYDGRKIIGWTGPVRIWAARARRRSLWPFPASAALRCTRCN